MHVKSEKAFQREVALANASVSAVRLSIERQHERDGMFGDGPWRISWNSRDCEPEPLRGAEIDVVESGPPKGNQARPLPGERAKRRFIDMIIDERADYRRPRRQGYACCGQVSIHERKIVRATGSFIGGRQKFAVIWFCAENGDLHGTIPAGTLRFAISTRSRRQSVQLRTICAVISAGASALAAPQQEQAASPEVSISEFFPGLRRRQLPVRAIQMV